MATPAEVRKSTPVFEEARYLNTGASGPSPRPVVERAQETIERHEWESAADPGPYPYAFGVYEDARADAASFIGAEAHEIALTQSTTDGINRIAGAMEWESGDVIVRTDLEHPAGILPWERLERRGCEVRIARTTDGRIDRDAYRDAVADAKLVCLSALTWNYGTHLPVEELVADAHDAGARVLVDAVQVPGQCDVDVGEWGADAVAMASHKWMLGLWGGGFLYVNEDVVEELHPGQIGYRSVEESGAEEYELKDGAARFEIGTTNPAPYAALSESIDILESVGLDTIEAHIDDLARRFVDGVPEGRLVSPHQPESGLVTVRVDDPDATVERLREEYDVIVRSLPAPEGAVRASLHVYNNESDVERLLEGLTEIGW
ncbi:aminotransferase class V-fold PLP-dependent enzyme [Halobellus captivus]|uniref:aminotransferase class V-fold PLP-dependent enzyme n=1 Tax=Halobellus captivus TaxID=2592614 RepID=UPI0011A12F34|nr:aminotransferase class V-fold PLP-dependent enzyme [Halobellus captivus]